MQTNLDKAFLHSLPAPVLVLDNTLSILSASRSVCSVLGREFMDADGSITMAMAQFDGLDTLLKGMITKLQAPGMTDKFRWQNGQRTYNVTVSSYVHAEAILFSALFEDYTDHIMMTRMNDRARGYLESIMASLPLGIIVTDRNQMITNMNRTQESFFKLAGETLSLVDVVGQSLAETFPDEAQLTEKVEHDVLEQGAVFGGVTENFDVGGEERTFAVSFAPLHDESNNIAGMIRVCEDVTEKEKLEKELRKVEMRNMEIEAIRKVMVTLNHEINNALLSIMANAELLLRTHAQYSSDEKVMLNTIVSRAEKIADVTQQLSSLQEVKTREYLEGGPEMIVTNS